MPSSFRKADRNGRFYHKQSGYVFVKAPDHPHADSKGLVQEHRLIVEQAIGKTLPRSVIVHHVNGNRKHNFKGNLVVCPNDEYHKLLHQRTHSLIFTGSPNNRWCPGCQEFLPLESFYHTTRRDTYGNKKPKRSGYCKFCSNTVNRKSYERNKRKTLNRQKRQREQNPELFRQRVREASRKLRQKEKEQSHVS